MNSSRSPRRAPANVHPQQVGHSLRRERRDLRAGHGRANAGERLAAGAARSRRGTNDIEPLARSEPGAVPDLGRTKVLYAGAMVGRYRARVSTGLVQAAAMPPERSRPKKTPGEGYHMRHLIGQLRGAWAARWSSDYRYRHRRATPRHSATECCRLTCTPNREGDHS